MFYISYVDLNTQLIVLLKNPCFFSLSFCGTKKRICFEKFKSGAGEWEYCCNAVSFTLFQLIPQVFLMCLGQRTGVVDYLYLYVDSHLKYCSKGENDHFNCWAVFWHLQKPFCGTFLLYSQVFLIVMNTCHLILVYTSETGS